MLYSHVQDTVPFYVKYFIIMQILPKIYFLHISLNNFLAGRNTEISRINPVHT